VLWAQAVAVGQDEEGRAHWRAQEIIGALVQRCPHPEHAASRRRPCQMDTAGQDERLARQPYALDRWSSPPWPEQQRRYKVDDAAVNTLAEKVYPLTRCAT